MKLIIDSETDGEKAVQLASKIGDIQAVLFTINSGNFGRMCLKHSDMPSSRVIRELYDLLEEYGLREPV